MSAEIVLPFPLSEHEMRAACDADQAGPQIGRAQGRLWDRVAEGLRR